MKLWPIALIASALLAQSPKKEQPAQDTFERSVQCEAQAEKIAQQRKSSSKQFVGWNNHYSPKYYKCFLEMFFLGPGDSLQSELVDAFERNTVALYVVGGSDEKVAASLCTVEHQKHVRCDEALMFIEEHMSK